MGNFHPLDVVGRGSETQLQVGENLNYLIKSSRVKSNYILIVTIANCPSTIDMLVLDG